MNWKLKFEGFKKKTHILFSDILNYFFFPK